MVKNLVLIMLLFTFNAKASDLESSETQTTGRGVQSVKNLNTIPLTTQKSQDSQYYSPQQPIQQYYPIQYLQNPIQYQQPQHQPAMILIAQPAQVQQHLLTTAAQQLLQYFHGNPQARVQFLQGNFIPNIANTQPQAQPQYIPQQPLPYYHLMTIQQPQYQQYQHTPAPIPTHQVSTQIQSQPAAAYNVPQTTTTGSQEYTPYPITGQFGHSTSLNHITALAQLAAQKYVPQINYRNPPAIVTGLENFTPEQQAQIKAQLNSGQPITPLKSSTPLNSSALQQLYSSQTAGKAPDNNLSQDQYQSGNINEDSKGALQGTATSQNYPSNNVNNNNSNNYNTFGTKG